MSENGNRMLAAAMVVFAACAVAHVCAVERTWVGESGGNWSTAANWDPSGTPTETDVLVFKPTDETSVTVSSTVLAGAIRCESGITHILGSSGGVYMGNDTNEFYVAKDAVATCTNAFHAIRAKNGTAVFAKTGPGALIVGGATWSLSNYKFARYDIREGELRLPAAPYYPLNEPPIHVFSGAKLTCGGNYRIHTRQDVEVDAGGVVDLGNTTQYAQSILGDGVITNHASLSLWLGAGKCKFSGRLFQANSSGAVKFNSRPSGMSDEDWGFVIGASNTLASSKVELPAGEGNTVRFASDITNFWIGSISGNSGQSLLLEDEDGRPVNVHSDFYLDGVKLKFKGSGGAYFGFTRTISNSGVLADFTGTLGVYAGNTLTLGNNTAAGWPGVSNLSGLCVNGSIAVKNQNAETAVFDMPIYGKGGRIDFHSDAVVGNANMTNSFWLVYANSTLTMTGGCTSLNTANLYLYTGSSLVVTNGAKLVGPWTVPNRSYHPWNVLKRMAPLSMGGTGLNTASASLLGGGVMAVQNKMPYRFYVGPGSMFAVFGAMSTDCTAADPAAITVDGGLFRVGVYQAPYNFDVTPNTDAFELHAGAGGMHLDFDTPQLVLSTDHAKFLFHRGIKSGVTDGVDGGVVRTGGGWMSCDYPHSITGPFDNRDGSLILPNKSAVTGATEPLFGFGDFRLGNARLQYASDISSTFTLKLATAAGKAMYYDGAATVRQRESSAKPKQDVVIGPSSAAQDAALVRGGRGAALFLWNELVTDEPTSNGIVTVNGGLSSDVAGRVRAPVLHYVYRPSSAWDSGNHHLDFLSCTDAGALTAFTGETAGLAGGADSVAAVAAAATLSENASVAALRVDGISGVNAATVSDASPITISEGATLSVGDGANPAIVLLNNRSSQSTATIKGAGVLSFGASEGVVAVNQASSATSPARIDCAIAGTGGLSFVAPIDGASHLIGLGGANTYTGGTTINGAMACPTSSAAFSSGVVTLGDGEIAGGGILMAKSGLTIPNAMRIAGRGSICSFISNTETYGAVLFTESGEFSGDMEVYAPVRLSARGAGVRGKFSGVVSGDSVELWKCTGEIAFSGSNTYTGGTEVTQSTLVLEGSGTAGTGGVVLNDGTLRVENAAARTISNPVSGIGTLALAGNGEVAFASLAPENEGFVLDVCGGNREIASLAGIASITNSSEVAGRITVTANTSFGGEISGGVSLGVADGVSFRLDATATLPADARVYIGADATLDLGGATHPVRTVYNKGGSVVNGSFAESNPYNPGTLVIFM